jgi:hypothetical protein
MLSESNISLFNAGRSRGCKEAHVHRVNMKKFLPCPGKMGNLFRGLPNRFAGSGEERADGKAGVNKAFSVRVETPLAEKRRRDLFRLFA